MKHSDLLCNKITWEKIHTFLCFQVNYKNFLLINLMLQFIFRLIEAGIEVIFMYLVINFNNTASNNSLCVFILCKTEDCLCSFKFRFLHIFFFCKSLQICFLLLNISTFLLFYSVLITFHSLLAFCVFICCILLLLCKFFFVVSSVNST